MYLARFDGLDQRGVLAALQQAVHNVATLLGLGLFDRQICAWELS
jgi:hypothetical protein